MNADAIDLATVAIINAPDVRDWPATATLTKLDFRPSGLHIEHTKTDAWPNVPDETKWAKGDGVQYTVWLFAHINGQWYASGGIEFWKGCDQNGGPPEQFGHNWFYAHDRWHELADYQPNVGELVGFMVSAGDARDKGKSLVQERSNIVRIPFPKSGDVVTFSPDTAPASPSTSEPLPPAPAAPGDGSDGGAIARYDAIMIAIDGVRVELAAIERQLTDQQKRFDTGVKSLTALAKQLVLTQAAKPKGR
jgi:hypothetical protein